MERELLLLGLLRRTELHGYLLHEFIEQNLASCTDLKKPTAYYLLDKMAERGWIVSAEEASEGNRPPRRVWRVTPEGETVYQQALRENLASAFTTRFTGNIGVAFLDDLEPQEACELLEQRRAQLATQFASLQHVPTHQGSLQWIIEHQKHFLQSEILWLNQVIAQLRGGSSS